MKGEKNLNKLIAALQPKLHAGKYVFTTQLSTEHIPPTAIIGQFKEKEGITVILKKEVADELELSYTYVASWITLDVHSALDSIGLTAIFSTELAKHNISCNVVAGFYHDHIFVDEKHGKMALKVLKDLSKNNSE